MITATTVLSSPPLLLHPKANKNVFIFSDDDDD